MTNCHIINLNWNKNSTKPPNSLKLVLAKISSLNVIKNWSSCGRISLLFLYLSYFDYVPTTFKKEIIITKLYVHKNKISFVHLFKMSFVQVLSYYFHFVKILRFINCIHKKKSFSHKTTKTIVLLFIMIFFIFFTRILLRKHMFEKNKKSTKSNTVCTVPPPELTSQKWEQVGKVLKSHQ